MVLVAVLLASCAVTEPRHGFTASATGTRSGLSPGESSGDVAGDELDGTPDGSGSEVAGPSGGTAGTGPGAGGRLRSGGQGGAGSSGGGGGGGAQQPGGGGGAAPEGSGEPTVGVTDDAIVVSVSMPFSRHTGALYEGWYRSAIETWAADVNATGGIHGRRVVLKKVDNGNTNEGATAACKEAQANGSFVTLIHGNDAEADCLDAAGRSALHTLSQDDNADWTHVKVLYSGPAIGSRTAEYLKGPLAQGGKKIGLLYINDVYTTSMASRFKQRAGELGMNVVGEQKAAVSQPSFTAELTRLRASGAEAVAIFAGTEIMGILRDAKAMSYQPVFTGGPWAIDEFSSAAAELFTGIQTVRHYTTVDSPAFREYAAKVRKYGTATTVASTDMLIYGYAVVLGEALKRAGPNLTQESFEAGMNATQGYDSGILPPITWGADRLAGATGAFPVGCCNSDRTWKSLGPAQEAF